MSPRSRARLGIFVDAAFRSGPEGVLFCGNEAIGFMRFASAVGRHFDGLTVIARSSEDREEAAHPLPEPAVLSPLPHYPSLRDLRAVVAALPATIAALWRAIGQVDLVWVSAGHPFGLLLVLFAILRGRRSVILVRQDSVAYFRARLPNRGWTPVLAPLWGVDRIFRLLGRWLPVTAVGETLAADFGAPRENVLAFTINLTSRRDIASGPASGDWKGPVELLTVGRIEPEKAPELLIDALARLNGKHPGKFRLTWVGDGRLRDRVEALVRERGLEDLVELPGFVPLEEGLSERYRAADAFVHVAVTEGLPQVLSEAMGAGLPIVATDVGGVRGALAGGAAGLLVPPGDASAICDAVLALAADPGLRRRLATAGIALAQTTAIEAESERVAHFMGGEKAPSTADLRDRPADHRPSR